ncbi:CLUMA_CG000378, isoform A [Clunio marinus]|uniref:CLUMA_CG000378, isoform A n=1 Tax=Clunio marinus TaxID=568069 RepID=A0A1J1HG23_9DIPT|nr:CLUMA_CG000378, isoform A [Clunio marinus]
MWKLIIFISILCAAALTIEENKNIPKNENEDFVSLIGKILEAHDEELEVQNVKGLDIVEAFINAYCNLRPTARLCRRVTTPGIFIILRKGVNTLKV